MNIERRRFIANASRAMTAGAAATIADAPSVIAQPKVQWRMSTAFTKMFDVHHGTAQRLAQVVDETSGGRFRIEVFPAGQILPAFDCFDAASEGKIDAFFGSPQYWREKEPALEWFGTIPFGMNCQGMAAWFYQADGLKLWEEGYAAFNLVPRPALWVAPQMAGWFRKKINTTADYSKSGGARKCCCRFMTNSFSKCRQMNWTTCKNW